MQTHEESAYSIREAIIQVIIRWRILLLLALLGILGAMVRHKYFPVYPGQGKLLIKDQSVSSLNTALSQFAGQSNLVANSGMPLRLDRSLAYLETTGFNHRLAEKIWSQMNDSELPESMSVELRSFGDSLKLDFEAQDPAIKEEQVKHLANSLRTRLRWNKTQGGILMVRVKTDRKAWTIHLINEALFMAREYLTERELGDIEEASQFFSLQIYEVERRLRDLEVQTMQALKRSDMLNVDAERGEASQYLTTLRKNISDTEIKIREGQSVLSELKGRAQQNTGVSEEAALSKFALSGQIRHLEDDLRTLQIRRETLSEYVKSYGETKKGILPVQNEMERIQANYEFEFKIYESLRSAMAKIGLEKTFIENQIEILELESPLKVFSRPGFLVLLLIAVTISQILGLFFIAVIELFH
jgi:hypothetical protein